MKRIVEILFEKYALPLKYCIQNIYLGGKGDSILDIKGITQHFQSLNKI